MNIRLSDRCHHCHFVVDCSTNFSVSSDPFDSSKIHPWFSHIPNISHPGKFNYAASERSVRNIVAIGAKILEEDVSRKLDRTRVIGRILGRRTFVSRSPLIKLASNCDEEEVLLCRVSIWKLPAKLVGETLRLETNEGTITLKDWSRYFNPKRLGIVEKFTHDLWLVFNECSDLFSRFVCTNYRNYYR